MNTSTTESNLRWSQSITGNSATRVRYTAMNHSGLTTRNTARPTHSRSNTAPSTEPNTNHVTNSASAGTASRCNRRPVNAQIDTPRACAFVHACRCP